MEEVDLCFFVSFFCDTDANTFEAVSVLATEVLLSSVFALFALCFMKYWASAFCLSQSLKLRRVGLTLCFLTVKSNHGFFMFGFTLIK